MAETKMMASAVALPEDASEQSPPTNGLKRRQSGTSEQENKRQRTSSPGKNPPTDVAPKDEEEAQREEKDPPPKDTGDHAVKPAHNKTEDPREARRKSGVTDEKQRSKRLFGALLGNLNQPGDRVSRRRSEIEQRRKAELQKQDDERLEDRQKRLEKLALKRKKEQVYVDEQNMRMRHKGMLQTAEFLQTRTEPKLYYKPWDLRTDEEDRIDDQIEAAQDQIDKELADWEEEKQKRLDALDAPEGELADKQSESKPTNVGPGDEAPKEIAPSEADTSADNAEKHTQEVSTNTTEKPAEIPESPDPGEHTNGDGPQQASKEPDDPKAEETKAEDSKVEDPSAGEPSEEQKEDMEDDGEQVVEGDEDDVIY